MNILITGASSGIGKACAELLAGQGNQVFALARRFSTGHERRIGNGLLHEVHCDVTSDALCAEAVEYMRSHAKTIDALVCCAGTGIAGVAVISGLFAAADKTEAAQAFLRQLEGLV